MEINTAFHLAVNIVYILDFSLGLLSYNSYLYPVCSGSKAEMDFGETAFALRIHRLCAFAICC